MAGFDQALKYLKDHRNEQVSVRLPRWSQDVDIRLRTAQDDRKTRDAGQPTHDYLTAASRHGYIPGSPPRSSSYPTIGSFAMPEAKSPTNNTCPQVFPLTSPCGHHTCLATPQTQHTDASQAPYPYPLRSGHGKQAQQMADIAQA